jgi:hypothetical protein
VRDYNERMLIAYNYCGGVSYGFIHKITEKYLKNEKKIYIINFELNPSSYGLFHETKIDKKFESNSSNQVFEQSPNKYILVYEKSFWENGKYRSFVILKYSISS